jgi:hypothetical protein
MTDELNPLDMIMRGINQLGYLPRDPPKFTQAPQAAAPRLSVVMVRTPTPIFHSVEPISCWLDLNKGILSAFVSFWVTTTVSTVMYVALMQAFSMTQVGGCG